MRGEGSVDGLTLKKLTVMPTPTPDSAVKPLPYKLPLRVGGGIGAEIKDAEGFCIADSCLDVGCAAALVFAANAHPAHERCRETLHHIALLADWRAIAEGDCDSFPARMDAILAKARAALAVEVGGGK